MLSLRLTNGKRLGIALRSPVKITHVSRGRVTENIADPIIRSGQFALQGGIAFGFS